MKNTQVFLIVLLGLALTAAVANAEEDFPGLVNLNFETGWSGPDYDVPGWEHNGGHNFNPVGHPAWYSGGELPRTGYRLKFEIAEVGETTGLLFKEVNWGSVVGEINVSVWAACRTWGSGSLGGEVGIGVDPDGGATSWGEVAYSDLLTGTDIGWTQLSTGTITKPGGATTFTLVLYAHRFENQWNCQVDDVEVDTDVSFEVPPGTPPVSSPDHTASVWTANDDPAFWFETFLADFYSYELDNSPSTVPPEVSDGTPSTVSYTDIANYDVAGEWWFHVRAGNSYGWSDTAHFGPLLIDDAPPTVSSVDWSPGPEGGVIITATANDTGGSPFGLADIEVYGDEKVSNGSFESGLVGWATEGGGPFKFNSTVFNPGGPTSGSLYFSSTTQNQIDGALHQAISSLGAGRYRLSTNTYVGAGPSETTTLNLRWIDGAFGGPEIPLQTVSRTDDSTHGWMFVSGIVNVIGDTITPVLRMLSTVNTSNPVGIHLDDVSFLWYPGAPDSYNPGTGATSWGPIPGINGETPTVEATDGAGNSASDSALTPLSGIETLAAGVILERWEVYE